MGVEKILINIIKKEEGVGVGRPENLLPCFTPSFSKTVLVTERVAMGAFGAFALWIAAIFQAGADFEVKAAIAIYVYNVVLICLGQMFDRFFLFSCFGSRAGVIGMFLVIV